MTFFNDVGSSFVSCMMPFSFDCEPNRILWTREPRISPRRREESFHEFNKAFRGKIDFTCIEANMMESEEVVVKALGVKPGLKVLQVGCGDGTTVVPTTMASSGLWLPHRRMLDGGADAFALIRSAKGNQEWAHVTGFGVSHPLSLPLADIGYRERCR